MTFFHDIGSKISDEWRRLHMTTSQSTGDGSASLAPKPATNPTREEFFTKLLEIELTVAPDNGPHERPANFAELVTAWVTQATLEDSPADWNPSDTTQPEDGATPFNTFGPGGRYHVWNYVSAEQGISAWLSTIGLPEYAPLRRVLHDPTSDLRTVLAAIATSPWTGLSSDPTLYDGVTPDGTAVVPGPGGWPFTAVVTTPAPAPVSQETAAETEADKVQSAINAQVEDVIEDEAKKPVDKAAIKAKIAEIEVHLAELKDLAG